jgi:replicative DNA helicase
VVDRVDPHSLEAERSVLGAILIDNEAFNTASAIVTPVAFYREAHRRIFNRMTDLVVRRSAIDFVTLRAELERTGELEDVGGPAYLVALVDGMPRAVNIEYYARIVQQKHELRELIKAANATLDEAFSSDEPAEIIERAESRLLRVSRDSARGDFTMAPEWMRGALQTIERNADHPRAVTGLSTSIARLDRMTRGLQPSNLIIIGARTAVGKTSLALQMALHQSRTVPVAFLSLEMSKEELSYRAVSLESRVDAHRLQTGEISAHESRLVIDAAASISERRIGIKDPGHAGLQSLRADIRRWVTRDKGAVAYVDYLQLVDGPEKDKRAEVVSAISRALKNLAMELGIPIVALSQLSRDAVKNDRPQLHHLKESGSLEQDANVVLLLHRPKLAEDGGYRDGEEAELIVAKNRAGQEGLIKLQWRASLTRFADPTEDHAEQRAFL